MGKRYDEKNGKVGNKHKAEPIKNVKDIQKIKQYLLGKNSKRDYALFVVGINIGLRASDLVKLKVGEIYNIERGEVREKVRILELKTGKEREFTVNSSAKNALYLYFSERGSLDKDDWVFQSQKHSSLHVKSVARMIREVGRELGLPYNLSSHSLRKTFGYQAYISNIQKDNGFIYTLQSIFNHSSAKTTLRYIDIDIEKISNVYQELNL